MRKKTIIITTVVLSVIVFIGYMVNKHRVTITDYSNGGISKTIFVFDLSTIKKIPNYEKEEGFELVFKSDYDKYHQGYCLKENKILSDEEIFRRGITQQLKKLLTVVEKISTFRFNNYGNPKDKEPVKYYLLSEVNATNWYEKFTANYDITKKSGLKEMLFKTFKAKPIDDIAKYLTIDMNTMTAGFKEPIVLGEGDGTYIFMVGKAFFLYKWGNKHAFNNFYATSFVPKKEIYKSDKLRYEENQKRKGGGDGSKAAFQVDHCGNVDYNIKKKYIEYSNP